MSSTVHYLGHAGFIVQHNGTNVLVDPWFFPAFMQSWFPYPDNRFLLNMVCGRQFDYLYVSHLHQDHFDRRLLEMMDRHVKILAPNYRSKSLIRKFHALGYQNVIPLDHRQSHDLSPGLTATMFLDTSHKEDSGLLLDIGGFRFLDLNDCNMRMSELPTDIDALAAQYSGAMWYPNCYDYSPEIMKNKVDSVRRDLMDTLVWKVRLTNAKHYIPSAGPACFLDPALMHFNDRDKTIFPIWRDVSNQFTAMCSDVRVLPLQPGDRLRFDVSERSAMTEPAEGRRSSEDRTSEDIDEYSKRRRVEWGEFYRAPERPLAHKELETYFATLHQKNKHLLHDFRKHIRLATGGNIWKVQLGHLAEHFIIDSEEPFDPEYSLFMPMRVLQQIIDGREGWEEALLSMRVALHRDPDLFDSRFMGLLRYGHEPVQTLQMVREFYNTETIERDGLRMQRYCPHAGEDLTYALVCGGVVECPRHHWKWDVQTGKCIEGGRIALRIEIIDRSKHPATAEANQGLSERNEGRIFR
jgi:UDP-MurNAc hydroxylase